MGHPNRVPAPRATRAEIAEAMNDARPLAAQLRAALQKRDELGPAPLLKVAGALRETIGSLRADIRSVANRAHLDENGLICLLAEEDRHYRTYRRRPSVAQLARAISRGGGEAERDLMAEHEEVAAASRRLEEKTRTAIAYKAAGDLLRGAVG